MADVPLIDDKTILDESGLWRRITPVWVVRDDNQGGWRVSKAAFSDSRGGSPMSVLLSDVVRVTGRSHNDVLARFEGYYLVELSAGAVRACGQGVARAD